MKNPGRMKYVTSQLVATLLSLSMVILLASAAQAAINCTQCHGDGTSALPVDTTAGSAFRNITTGAVKGNHSTHSGVVTTGAPCAKCHGSASAPAAAYQSNHAILSNYSIRMVPAVSYSKGNSFRQSATPTLGYCSNVNCHFKTVTPTWGQSVTYTSQKGASSDAGNTCAQCHLGATLATGKHTAHISLYGNNLTACTKCHPDNFTPAGAAAFSHVTSSTTSIRFSFAAAPNNGTGSATGLRVSPNYLPGGTSSTATCSNVYCHSVGNLGTSGNLVNAGGVKYRSIVWTAGALGCVGCHGDQGANAHPVYTSGLAGYSTANSHVKHVENRMLGCDTCHYNTVTQATLPPTQIRLNDYSGHLNRAANIRIKPKAGYTGSFTPGNGASAKTCSNVYCHSTGRADKPQFSTPQWGNNTSTCLSCHGGRTSASGTYTYSAGSGAFRLSTTHSQHLKYPAANINCQICHSKSATDAATLNNYSSRYIKHGNAVKDVTFTSVTYGSYSSYKSTAMGSGSNSNKCGNVSCHGGTSRSAWSKTWINNDNTCVNCHGTAGTLASVANSGDNRKFFAPGWNKTGIDTDGDVSRQNFQVGAHFKHLSSVLMKKIKCNECHYVPSTPFDGTTHMAQPRFTASQTLTFAQASSAKIVGGATPTQLVVFTGYTSGTAGKAATCSSVYCHGNRLKNLDTGGVNTYRKPMWTYSGMTRSSSDLRTITCGRCHGNPPSSVSPSHSGQPATTSCTGCHGTVVDAAGNIINKALHINGVIDASGCTGCHGNPPTYGGNMVSNPSITNALGGSAFNAHSTHVKTKQMNCYVCHNGFTVSGMGGSPGAIEIGFAANNTNWSKYNAGSPAMTFGSFSGNQTLNSTYSYAAGTGQSGTTVRTGNGTRNSCNVYCHGGWTGSGRKINPSWIGTTQTLCGNCHSATAATPPTLGSHTKHVVTYKNSCTTCHPARSAGVDHVDGAVQWKFSTSIPRVGGSAAYNRAGATGTGTSSGNTNALAGSGTYGSCNGIYCHSSGRTDTVQFAATPTWGGGVTCLSCHGGRASASGAYTFSGSGFRMSTTHSQHLKYPAANINCQMCHSKTAVTNAATLNNYSGQYVKHANRVKDVTFTDITYGSYSSYKSTAMGSSSNSNKCGNVSCHGGTTRSAWSKTFINTDNTCVHCHGTAGTLASVPNSGDNRKFFAPGWNKTGIDTDGDVSRQNFQVGAHFKHLSSVLMRKIKCNECHYVPSTPFDGTTHMAQPRFTVSQTLTFGQASTAKILIGVAAGSTPTMLATFSGYTSGTAGKAATCSSVYCHGNRLKNGDTGGANIYRKPMWNFSGMTRSSSDQLGITCGRCHGNPPSSVTASHSGVTPTTGCSSCHGAVVNGSGKIINKSLHINGTVTAASCNSCHGNPPTTNSNMVSVPSITNALGGSAFNAHSTHNKTRKMQCNTCHNGFTASGMGGSPGAIEIGFDISNSNWATYNANSPAVTFGSFSGNQTLNSTYSYAASSGGTTVRTGNGTRNSCNVYCHGGWTGSGRKINPSWIGATQTACGNCHSATTATPPTLGSHTKHAATYKNSCTTCHPGRFTPSDHVDGAVQWKFSTSIPRVGGSAAYNRAGASGTGTSSGNTQAAAGSGTYGSCSGIYCHSTGRTDTVQFATTPAWGGGTSCLSCHGGRASASGAYTFSTGGFRLSSSHSQHLKYPAANINCQMCHAKTAQTDAATLNNYSGKYVKHANKVKDVTFTDLSYGTYSAYKGSRDLNKCGNISCHGGKSRNGWSTTWINTDNTCVHCHGVSGTTTVNTNRNLYAPGWNSTGISTDGNTVASDRRVGAHFGHLSSLYMKKLKCNECHIVPDSNPFTGTHMTGPRYSSQTISFAQSSTAMRNSIFISYTAGTAAKAATCSTVFCHGAKMVYGSTNGTNTKPSWDNTAYLSGTPAAPGDCTKCHGAPPNSTPGSHSGVTANNLAVCGNCHSNLDPGGIFKNKSLHVNGIVEAPTACNGCHDYDTTGVGGKSWGFSAKAVDGYGAHARHINFLRNLNGVTLNPLTDTFGNASFNAVCGVCHTKLPANHKDSTRQINFGDDSGVNRFGLSNPVYNGVVGVASSTTNKTCSNLDCHFKLTPVWP